MVMRAVIQIQWHQYIVSVGDTLLVDQMAEKKEGDSVSLDKVLLLFDEKGEKVSVGTPYVKNASVSLKVLGHQKWKKIKVFKFQGKKRYHRTRGFKPSQTLLSVEKITS